jgi:hypothetical protein
MPCTPCWFTERPHAPDTNNSRWLDGNLAPPVANNEGPQDRSSTIEDFVECALLYFFLKVVATSPAPPRPLAHGRDQFGRSETIPLFDHSVANGTPWSDAVSGYTAGTTAKA